MEPKRVISRDRQGPVGDLRVRMIQETEAWLSRALANSDRLPRIPRRRTDDGGFTALLKRPGARSALQCWWSRALDLVDHIS